MMTRYSLVIISMAVMGASAVQAQMQGLNCSFQRICNNFQACEDVTYEMTIAPASEGWVFRDADGERAAIALPQTQDGKGTVAFASHASFETTMLVTVYSGGVAQMVDVFEEPGFFSSTSGTCEVIQ